MSVFDMFNKGESTDNSLTVDDKGTIKDVSTGDVVNSQSPEIVINSQGDTKNVNTGEIHLENPQQVQEPVQPPSQNDIDLNKYNESLQPPLGTIPQVLEEGGNTGSFVVATEKVADTGLGKTFNEKGEIINKTSDTTESSSSQPKENISPDEERYDKFQDTGQNQRTDSIKIDGRSKWAKQYKEEVEKKAIHQEALDLNKQANEGSVATTEHSDIRKNFFTTEDEIAQKARQEAERERLHQEALNSNREANEGYAGGGLSNEGKRYFARQDELSNKAREDGEQQSELSEIEYLRNTVTELTQRVEELTRLIEQLRNPIITPPRPPVLEGDDGTLTPPILTPPPPVLEGDDGTLTPPILTPPPPPVLEDNNKGQENERTLRMGERGAVLPPLVHSDPEERARQQQELRTAREQFAPEQISARLGWELAQLGSIATQRPLTDQEKIRWFEIYREKKELDRGIGERTEIEDKRRKNREKIITAVAVGVGGLVAIATPPVTVAAVIAVGFGGKFLGMGMRHFEKKFRAKSNVMKYVNRMDMSLGEIKELDKKQRNNEIWANILGGAAAAVTGGVGGYAIGSALQNVFGWQIGGGAPTPTVEPASTLTDSGSNIPVDTDQEMIIREANKLKAASSGVDTSGATQIPTVDTAGVQVPPVEQAISAGGSEGWVHGDTLNIKELGWKWYKNGTEIETIALGPRGGDSGEYQDAFLKELEKLIPKTEGILDNKPAGDVVLEGLRLVGGERASPVEAADQVAKILTSR